MRVTRMMERDREAVRSLGRKGAGGVRGEVRPAARRRVRLGGEVPGTFPVVDAVINTDNSGAESDVVVDPDPKSPSIRPTSSPSLRGPSSPLP